MTDLRQGKFILLYDNEQREGETDFVISSQFLTPRAVRQMRKDGGGLIFLMISNKVANHLKLPFLADVFAELGGKYPVFKALIPNDIPYDTKSSFSISLNHRETFTGITDIDRCMTMKKFAELIQKTSDLKSSEAVRLFGSEFRSPGHVPLCIASKKLLSERTGHTELVVAMMEMAGLLPVGSGCEIMGDNGKALSKKDTLEYAHKNHFVFIEGKDVVKAWKQWSR